MKIAELPGSAIGDRLIDDFRARMGSLADGRSDEELFLWRAALDWFAELAIAASSPSANSRRISP